MGNTPTKFDEFVTALDARMVKMRNFEPGQITGYWDSETQTVRQEHEEFATDTLAQAFLREARDFWNEERGELEVGGFAALCRMRIDLDSLLRATERILNL